MVNPAILNPQRSYAVLIGSSRYESLPQLPSVNNNLAVLRRLLTDQRLWGLPTNACVTVSNPGSPMSFMAPISKGLMQDCG